MTQRKITMTIEIRVGVVGDAFSENEIIKLDGSAEKSVIPMAAAAWITTRISHDAALLEVLRFVYRAMSERMGGYHLWLLVGDSCWQDDTRIVRYRRQFSSLKAQGMNFEGLQDRHEFMVEQSGKLKFFGAVRLNWEALVTVPETMQPGSCIYLLALPDAVLPDLSKSSGWMGRVNEDFEFIRSNVQNDGIIFLRVGYFDDPEVGLVALGKPNIVAALTA